jgi:rhodanese-related sulfurtransferase
MRRKTIHDLLAEARRQLDRLEPRRAYEAHRNGALLVDIRGTEARRADGAIPGSIHIMLDVLEWRMDPESGGHDPRVGGVERQVILICREGYSSSLAARRLQEIGFTRATDVVGGFEAWAAEGLPVDPAL